MKVNHRRLWLVVWQRQGTGGSYVRGWSLTGLCLQIQTWMQLAGMQSWIDPIGNVHGEIKGPDAVEGAVVLGSHYDTVRDAGAYDGTLGIVTAISAVKGMVLAGSDASALESLQGEPSLRPASLAASTGHNCCNSRHRGIHTYTRARRGCVRRGRRS